MKFSDDVKPRKAAIVTNPQIALGKVHQINGQGGYQETYHYDTLGRPTQVVNTVNGQSYQIDTSYDSLHRADTITYPGPSNRLQVKNVYNNLGFNVELRNAANNELYYGLGDMDARGNITGDVLGNGISPLRYYTPETGCIERIRGYGLLDRRKIVAPIVSVKGSMFNPGCYNPLHVFFPIATFRRQGKPSALTNR